MVILLLSATKKQRESRKAVRVKGVGGYFVVISV